MLPLWVLLPLFPKARALPYLAATEGCCFLAHKRPMSSQAAHVAQCPEPAYQLFAHLFPTACCAATTSCPRSLMPRRRVAMGKRSRSERRSEGTAVAAPALAWQACTARVLLARHYQTHEPASLLQLAVIDCEWRCMSPIARSTLPPIDLQADGPKQL